MRKNSGIHVTLKAASTLDGKIATANRRSKWITGEAARLKAHELRHENDAVLVGINTVLVDDPELTVRGVPEGRSPVRIVMDSMARIPKESRVFKKDGVHVVIVTGIQAPSRTWPKLAELTILTAPTKTPEVLWVLSEMRKLGLKSLLVEGGSLIHSSFLRSNSADQLELFLAPKVIGGQESLSWCGNLAIDCVNVAPELHITSVTSLGKDLLISAKIE